MAQSMRKDINLTVTRTCATGGRGQSRSENDWRWTKSFSRVMGPCQFALISLFFCGEGWVPVGVASYLSFVLRWLHASEDPGMIQ